MHIHSTIKMFRLCRCEKECIVLEQAQGPTNSDSIWLPTGQPEFFSGCPEFTRFFFWLPRISFLLQIDRNIIYVRFHRHT